MHVVLCPWLMRSRSRGAPAERGAGRGGSSGSMRAMRLRRRSAPQAGGRGAQLCSCYEAASPGIARRGVAAAVLVRAAFGACADVGAAEPIDVRVEPTLESRVHLTERGGDARELVAIEAQAATRARRVSVLYPHTVPPSLARHSLVQGREGRQLARDGGKLRIVCVLMNWPDSTGRQSSARVLVLVHSP